MSRKPMQLIGPADPGRRRDFLRRAGIALAGLLTAPLVKAAQEGNRPPTSGRAVDAPPGSLEDRCGLSAQEARYYQPLFRKGRDAAG